MPRDYRGRFQDEHGQRSEQETIRRRNDYLSSLVSHMNAAGSDLLSVQADARRVDSSLGVTVIAERVEKAARSMLSHLQELTSDIRRIQGAQTPFSRR